MKITDIQIINFAVETNEQKTKWGYGQRGPQKKVPNGLINRKYTKTFTRRTRSTKY